MIKANVRFLKPNLHIATNLKREMALFRGRHATQPDSSHDWSVPVGKQGKNLKSK